MSTVDRRLKVKTATCTYIRLFLSKAYVFFLQLLCLCWLCVIFNALFVVECCSFSSRVSILTRDIDRPIAIMSVCPSVRHVPVFYGNGLTYCHSFFTYDSPIILVLWISNIFAKFRRAGGTKCRWGMIILRFSTNKLLYLANDTR